MNEWRVSGHLIDGVIAFTLLEAVLLMAYRWRTGAGVRPRDFIVNMGSGLCLMLALRAALAHSGAIWIAGFLVGAGAAHGVDLWMRWSGRAPARDALRSSANFTASP